MIGCVSVRRLLSKASEESGKNEEAKVRKLVDYPKQKAGLELERASLAKGKVEVGGGENVVRDSEQRKKKQAAPRQGPFSLKITSLSYFRRLFRPSQPISSLVFRKSDSRQLVQISSSERESARERDGLESARDAQSLDNGRRQGEGGRIRLE